MEDYLPYDYVIELEPDDEYRQVAEAIRSIQDFDELDIDDFIAQSLLDEAKRQQAQEIASTKSLQSNPDIESGIQLSDLKRNDSSCRSIASEAQDETAVVISKEEFSNKMQILQARKEWICGAARRSSLGFQDRYQSPDSVAMNKFLVALAGGVTLIRHQANHQAEYIRLHSENGCITMLWDQESSSRDLQFGVPNLKKKRHSKVDSFTQRLFGLEMSNPGISNENTDGAAGTESSESQSKQKESQTSWKNYFFFKRRGKFHDKDLIAVHPASRRDPTCPGFQGTYALRASRDIYNESYTFSLVLWNGRSLQGYVTLDLECESFEMYTILLHGFYLMSVEAAAKRTEDSKMSTLDRMGITRESIAGIWYSAQSMVASIVQKDNSETIPIDPIEQLFQPTSASILDTHEYSFDSIIRRLLPKKKVGHELKVSTKSLPPAQFLGWTSAGTQIWARLKMAGLEVKCIFSWDLKKVILNVRCPQWRLEEVAEHIHLKLRNRDGTLKRFRIHKRDSFAPQSEGNSIFKSSERQHIIDFLIRSKIRDGGAELNEGTELGKFISQKFPLHMPKQLDYLRHSWLRFWRMSPELRAQRPSSTSFCGPLYDNLMKLHDSLYFISTNVFTQPLDSVAEYYGEGIAFYFAYLGYYTRWLLLPSAVGFFVFCFQIKDGQLDHWMCVPYSIFIMIWAAFMLAYWRQYQSTLAYKWGMLGFEVEETERPQYYGKYVYDEELGEIKKEYPMWKRALKYTLTIPVLISTMLAMFFVMTTFYSTQTQLYQEYVNHLKLDYFPKFRYSYGSYSAFTTPSSSPTTSTASYLSGHSISDVTANITSGVVDTIITALSSAHSNGNGTSTNSSPVTITMSRKQLHDPKFWTVMFLYPCLYGILVDTLSYVFEHLALASNEFENHRTQTQYLNRLIVKVFTFRIFTVFTTLYYIAFFSTSKAETYIRISVTIFCLMTVGQWWGMLLDVCVPMVARKFKLRFMLRKSRALLNLVSSAEEYLAQLPDSTGTDIVHKLKTDPQFDDHAMKRLEELVRNKTSFQSLIEKRRRYLEESREAAWSQALSKTYATFQDYTMIIAQLGFILFFSAIFPLAPLIALLNNTVLIRLHACKLCYVAQRPIAQKSSGIGVWEDVLQVMSVVGIVTSCGIIGYTSDTVRNYLASFGTTGLALLLFGLEHTILLVKYFLHTAIPRVPESVLRAQARGKVETASKERSSRRRRTADASDHLKYKKRAFMASPGAISADNKSYFDDDEADMRSPTTMQSIDSHQVDDGLTAEGFSRRTLEKLASFRLHKPIDITTLSNSDSYSPCNIPLTMESPTTESSSDSVELRIRSDVLTPGSRKSLEFNIDEDNEATNEVDISSTTVESVLLNNQYSEHKFVGKSRTSSISFTKTAESKHPRNLDISPLGCHGKPFTTNREEKRSDISTSYRIASESGESDSGDSESSDEGFAIDKLAPPAAALIPQLGNRRESWSTEFQKRLASFTNQREQTRKAEDELMALAQASKRIPVADSILATSTLDVASRCPVHNLTPKSGELSKIDDPKLIPVMVCNESPINCSRDVTAVPASELDNGLRLRGSPLKETRIKVLESHNQMSNENYENSSNPNLGTGWLQPLTGVSTVASSLDVIGDSLKIDSYLQTQGSPNNHSISSPISPQRKTIQELKHQMSRKRRTVVVTGGPESDPANDSCTSEISPSPIGNNSASGILFGSQNPQTPFRNPPATSTTIDCPVVTSVGNSPLRSCLAGSRVKEQQSVAGVQIAPEATGSISPIGSQSICKSKKKITFVDDKKKALGSALPLSSKPVSNPFAFAVRK